MKKNQYRVTARCVYYATVDVKASSKEEAMELAEEIDGGEFVESPGDGEWDIIDAEKI